MVWPTRVRHPQRKHAFEAALDEASLVPDDALEDLVDDALANALAAPAVGSLGDITVAAGYVATASLTRAYGTEDEVPVAEPPADAARALKDVLASREHSAVELRLLRRRFAALNHPDRVAPELRAEAVAAMAEVNAEIDHALKRAKGA